MLYNKNRFKKLNVKKVLHKVKKQWVTISIALLGLLGVKSVAMHTNVNADANTSINNNSVDHLSNHAIASANSTLVNSNGGKLTSASTALSASSSTTGASLSNYAKSSSADQSVSTDVKGSKVASSAQSSTYHSSANHRLTNVPNEAEQFHARVLGQMNRPEAGQSRAYAFGSTPHYLLKMAHQAEAQNAQDNNSSIAQLMNIIHNNVQSGANEAGAKQAYADLLNQFSDLSSVTDSKPVSQWVSMLQNTDNYLHTIRNNGVDNQLLDKTVSKLDSIYSNAQYGAYTSKSYTLNQIATRFDTPGGFVHGILSNLTSEANLDKIATGMRIINQAATAGTLSNYYNNIISNLKALPNQNKAEQAGTLSQLSSDIKNFTQHIGNVPLSSNSSDQNVEQQLLSSSNPNGIVASLNNIGNAAQNEAAMFNNEVAADELNSINSKLNQYNVGSLFDDVINYVTANNDYAKLNDVANDAKTDFTDAANASAFINRFVGQIANLKNANATTISNDLNGFKNDSAISNAYNVAKANSNVANDVLDNLADLNSANAVSNLDNVHNVISGDTSLAAINALSNVAASASTEVTSLNNANAYQGLINNESELFSNVVNRINATGFNSVAFSTLVGNAENDLANAANVSDFADDLNGQAGAFDGVTAQELKGYLTNLKDNPEFSDAYQNVRANSAGADSILNDLSSMNPDNEATKLNDVANVAKTNFSNSAIFGSLATDANNMATSVSNSQSTAASQAYGSLLNDHEASLFSAVVNRIVARGFSSAAFKTLVNNAKTDLSSAANASEFVASLETQDGNFDGVTANDLKALLNHFAGNPEFNKAYQAVRADSASADDMLNDLAEMSAGNEVNELNNIQQTAAHNFSNPASFGSLATDAAHMANSVAANQPAHKEVTASSAINSLVSGLPASAALSYVASKFASSGFDKATLFDTLFNNAKVAFDNHNDTNASTFLNKFSAQAKADFPANDDEFINAAVSDMTSNPNVSGAYTFLRNNSAATNNVLSNLATMDPENASAVFNSVADIINNTTAFKNVPELSTAANSAVSAANSASVSASQSAVASVVESAQNDATAASNAVTDFETHNRNLPSNSDGQLASSEVLSNAASDAAKAGSYATDASNDAAEETGVHVAKGQLGVGLPQYVNDVINARRYRNNVRVDLENAQQDANLSREFANIDKEFNTLGVEPIFKLLLNNAVSHNDYSKLSMAAANALQAFNDNTIQGSTVNSFLEEFTGTGKTFNTLQNHADDPAIQDAYQIARQNYKATENVLNDLSGLNSSNAVNKLRKFHDDLTTNSVDKPDVLYKFNQLQTLDKIADDAQNEASAISDVNNVNNEVNGLITPDFVLNSVKKLVNEPNGKRTDFAALTTAVKQALASNNDVNGFVHDVTNNHNYKAFTGHYAGEINRVLNDLIKSHGNSTNGYYDQIKAQSDSVDKILNDLGTVADHPYKEDASQSKLALNDLSQAIKSNHNLDSVPGFDNVVKGAINAANSFADYAPENTTDQPHYAGQAFNNRLNYGLVKIFADYLANDTNRNDRKLFNNIFSDLKKLPNNNANNGTVNDIINNLGQFQGVLQPVAQKASGIFNMIKGHDASPSALATYADQLDNKEDGALINDFNKTMQDVKGQPNNTDYQKVLDELSSLNAKNEDRNLKVVAATINAHDLKNNPLFKNLALNARHVANAESSERKKDNAKRRKAEAAQKIALQNQHNADSKRHNALAKDHQQHQQDVARHNQIIQDHKQQQQDSIRHNKLVAARHQHNVHDASRAESYAKNASTEAQAAQTSAAFAQQYAHGLNSSGNAFGSSAGASMMVSYADSYEREAESDATQALDDVKAINSDYDNVSLADADVTNASSAASDASDAVNNMNNAITLASKYAKSDGYVAPSSSTSNGSHKSSGTSSSSSSTSSSATSGKSSTSSNGTKPSSQSSVTPSASNGKKKSGSASQSTSNHPSSKSAHASSGSASQTSGKSASGSANGSHSNSSKPASSKASNGSASQSTASSGKSNPSSQASNSASQSGNSNSASAPSSNQSNSNQPSSSSNSSASSANSANQSNAPMSNNNSSSSVTSNGSTASNGSSNASMSASINSMNSMTSQSTNGGSYNPFMPSNNQSALSFAPNISSNNSQGSNSMSFNSTANSGSSSANTSNSSSISASIYGRSDKINTDKTMVNDDIKAAMKDLNDPIIKRDPKITAEVNKDRQMIKQIQARINNDLNNPTPEALNDANACAVRAGLIASDANRLLNDAEYYGISHHSTKGHGNGSANPNSSTQSGEPAGQYTNQRGISSDNGTAPSANASNAGSSVNGQGTNSGKKLPQTGEAQNSAMLIMGLIALSAALISALGVDLDRKHRYE